jgi:hypothetical protein
MNDNQLDQQFRNLQREATPPYDLWPGIARRMNRGGTRWQLLSPRGLAAAAALFVTGVLVGRNWPEDRPGPAAGDTAFLAAVRVQETGTAYVGALAALDRVDRAGDGRAVMVAQGREAAQATISAALAAVNR